MNTILVVDDMRVFLEPIAAALKMAGYNINTAENGKIALDSVRKEKPDLILLDVAMPEMDGLAFLRVLRADPHLRDIPVILLTAVTEKNYVAQAAQLGIRDYLLKSKFSLEELMSRVKKYLGRGLAAPSSAKAESGGAFPSPPASSSGASVSAATQATAQAENRPGIFVLEDKPVGQLLSELEPILNKSEVYKMIREGLELKPLAATVHNVLAVTGSSRCTAGDVADKVAHDQGLSIRILKLANSSVYSRGRPVNSIKQAIGRIGIQQVRNLVMTLGVLEQYEGGISEYIDMRLFWEHSIGCGLIAAALAQTCLKKVDEDYFLLGMLHDVGRLILLDHMPEAYCRVFQKAKELDLPLHMVESKLLQLNHCEILKEALEQWRMPKEFIAPVVNHHQSIEQIKRLSPDQIVSAAIVNLTNRICHALLLGKSGDEVICPFEEFIDLLKLSPAVLEKILEEIPYETNNLKFTMLSYTSEDPWPDYPSGIKERLSTACRPICVSAEPVTDAYRIFFERIGDLSGEQPPNLGVIYLRDANEHEEIFRRFNQREQEEHCIGLPVIVICNKGKVDKENNWLRTRNRAIFGAPVTMAGLLNAVDQLLGKQTLVAAET